MTENLFFDMRIRNSIKINWLSVAASMLLVTVIGSVVLLFEFYTDDVYFNTRNFNYFLVFTLWFLFVLNYFVLEFLFNYYSKNQIRRITNILPEDIIHDYDSDLSFKELGEKMHEMNQKNAEIDMMKEMENYRKEYIGNISHELKTPLFSMQGYIETLRVAIVMILLFISFWYCLRISTIIGRNFASKINFRCLMTLLLEVKLVFIR